MALLSLNRNSCLKPLVMGGDKVISPASVILASYGVDHCEWMLNLVSTAQVLDANDADRWGESSRLSDQSYLLILAVRPACQLFITHRMSALASPLVYTQVIIDDVISLSDCLQWFSQNFSSF